MPYYRFEMEYIDLKLQDADVLYYPQVFNSTESQKYFKVLLKEIQWQQDNIKIFGKTYEQPRLTALYGNNQKPYSYSNIIMHPLVFTPSLLEIKERIENIVQTTFTTCLLNLYRNGQDSNGWHADDEKELGNNPTIASISFGEERIFHLKHKIEKKHKHKLILKNGSLLIMKGATQHYWKHQLPKTKKKMSKRINLTFRYIK